MGTPRVVGMDSVAGFERNLRIKIASWLGSKEGAAHRPRGRSPGSRTSSSS